MAGIFLCLVSGVSGQAVWNPDYNGDGQVTAVDLTGSHRLEMSTDSLVSSYGKCLRPGHEGEVPLDSVTFTLTAMDIQLREDSKTSSSTPLGWTRRGSSPTFR